MTKHAHEPWCVAPKSKHLIYSNIGDAIAECDGIIDGKSREWDHANAARIVSCVNACAGIADPSKLKNLLLECLALESCNSVDFDAHVLFVSRAFRDLVGKDFGSEGA